ncbi:SRPBCC family protein [Kordiimonas pumila]|uniref:SRPBCC family protein n=1 Tax=Kordiimonas pumila TaxID=2161677 RepID=A0ABV7D628_9PROT|nr:SRPBCC family protein [Kordiimonas pumila]
MDDFATLIESNTLRMVRLVPGPIERVWDYLTIGEKRAEWLAGGDMAQESGGTVELVFTHKNLTPFDDDLPENQHDIDCSDEHRMHGTVLVYDKPNRLTYTWESPDDSASKVTFELREEENGMVRLVLTHQNLTGMDEITSVSAGWHTHVAILSAKLAGETPPPFWQTYYDLRAEYINRMYG